MTIGTNAIGANNTTQSASNFIQNIGNNFIKQVVTLFNNQAGPLPKTTASFTTSGGTLIILWSGSYFTTTSGQIVGIKLQLDGVDRDESKYVFNEANSHKPSRSKSTVLTGVVAGNHTITLATGTGTNVLTNVNDFFDVTIIELTY